MIIKKKSKWWRTERFSKWLSISDIIYNNFYQINKDGKI